MYVAMCVRYVSVKCHAYLTMVVVKLLYFNKRSARMGATEKMLKIVFFTIQSYFKHCSYYNLVQELHLNSIDFWSND